MRLMMITDEVCPCCQSRIIMESIPRYHTNGEGFEKKGFECGCVLAWSPNFSCLTLENKCPHDNSEVKELEAFEDLKVLLRKTVKESTVGQKFKDRLLSSYDLRDDRQWIGKRF